MTKTDLRVRFNTTTSVTIPVALLDTLKELVIHTSEQRRRKDNGFLNGTSQTSYILKFDLDGILVMRSADLDDRYVPYLSGSNTWFRKAADGRVVEVPAGDIVDEQQLEAALQ